MLEDVVARSLDVRRFNLLLLGGFAAIALLLASVGVYGLLAQLVARRRAEIAVRITLGARSDAIVRLIGGGALASVGLGVCAGLGLALLGSRLLSRFVFGLSALDPLLYAAAAALLLTVACIAALVPLNRAMHVDPITVLRSD